MGHAGLMQGIHQTIGVGHKSLAFPYRDFTKQ